MGFLEKKMAIAITSVKSTKFPPIMSPKASCGIPWMAAFKSTNKFGSEAANAITKKAMINSRQCKYLATDTKDLTSREDSQDKIKQETINMATKKIQDM